MHRIVLRCLLAFALQVTSAPLCPLCPAGQGPSGPCDLLTTQCAPCPAGTFSPRSDHRRCTACSHCGPDLYELHPCSATKDVFCELCSQSELSKGNADYVKKCGDKKRSVHKKINPVFSRISSWVHSEPDLPPLPSDLDYDEELAEAPPFFGDLDFLSEADPQELENNETSQANPNVTTAVTVNPVDLNDGENDNDENQAVALPLIGAKPDKPVPEKENSEKIKETEDQEKPQGDTPSRDEDKKQVDAPVKDEKEKINNPHGKESESGGPDKQKDNVVGLPVPIDIKESQGTTHRNGPEITTAGQGNRLSTSSQNSQNRVTESKSSSHEIVKVEPSIETTQASLSEETRAQGDLIAEIDTQHNVEDNTTRYDGLNNSDATGLYGKQETDVTILEPPAPPQMLKEEENPQSGQATEVHKTDSSLVKLKESAVSVWTSTSPFALTMTIITSGFIFFFIGFFYRKGAKIYDQEPSPDEDSQTPEEVVVLRPKPILRERSVTPPAPIVRVSTIEGSEEEEENTGLLGESFDQFLEWDRQSPVDIMTQDVRMDPTLNEMPLEFHYEAKNSEYISNTGSTIKLVVDYHDSRLTGGPLGDRNYCLDHIQFHWGDTIDRGSDHTVDGRTYPAECHFVHWNEEVYESYEEAARSEGGLAIISVLLQVDGKKMSNHIGLDSVTENLTRLRYKGQEVPISSEGFDPKTLFPENQTDYWTYEGSLTTYPYAETVTWIIFRTPISISNFQIERFRQINKTERGKLEHQRLVNNYRSQQPLGDREIRANFEPEK